MCRQVLLNLSSLAEAELGAALAASATPAHAGTAAEIAEKTAEGSADDGAAAEGVLPPTISALPSASVAVTLGALMPLFKVYMPYVSALTSAQSALRELISRSPPAAKLIRRTETARKASLPSLLLAPARRLTNYANTIEAMLKETADGAAERDFLCRSLSAVREVCELLDASLAEQQVCRPGLHVWCSRPGRANFTTRSPARCPRPHSVLSSRRARACSSCTTSSRRCSRRRASCPTASRCPIAC